MERARAAEELAAQQRAERLEKEAKLTGVAGAAAFFARKAEESGDATKTNQQKITEEAARRKAEAVAGADDLGARGKAREIEKLYARARAGGGAKRGKPSRSAKISADKKGKPLDGRLRAEAAEILSKLDALDVKSGSAR